VPTDDISQRYLEKAIAEINDLGREIAQEAGAGYELAFFDGLEKRINALVHARVDTLHLCDLQACVKHLQGAKMWTRTCDSLREEVICFIRERLASNSELNQLRCYIR